MQWQCRCFLSLLWHVAPPGQYHAAAEAKQFRFMHLDACAWKLPRWPHRAAVAIKVPSPDPSRSYPAHCVHGVMDRALLFALRTSMAEHAPSRVAGLGALTLPTLPSTACVRLSRETRTGAPLSSLLLSGGTAASATQSCQFKAIIRSNTRFA